MQKTKDNAGITLIVLITTIVVLLILARNYNKCYYWWRWNNSKCTKAKICKSNKNIPK